MTHMRVLKRYMEQILTYECKSWTMNCATEKRINSVELGVLRRMQRISNSNKFLKCYKKKGPVYSLKPTGLDQGHLV